MGSSNWTVEINELIYFVQNGLDRLHKEDLVRICEAFYEEDFIEET